MINSKFNNNFKNHITFERIKSIAYTINPRGYASLKPLRKGSHAFKSLRINLVRLKVEENKRSECKGINEIGPPTHFIYEWIIIALFLLQLLGKLSLSMEMINLLYCDHPLKHFIIFHLNHIITLGDKIR
jgi:hypothetical protein